VRPYPGRTGTARVAWNHASDRRGRGLLEADRRADRSRRGEASGSSSIGRTACPRSAGAAVKKVARQRFGIPVLAIIGAAGIGPPRLLRGAADGTFAGALRRLARRYCDRAGQRTLACAQSKAEARANALRQMTAPNAHIVRDDKNVTCVEEVVPADIVCRGQAIASSDDVGYRRAAPRGRRIDAHRGEPAGRITIRKQDADTHAGRGRTMALWERGCAGSRRGIVATKESTPS